MNIKDVMKLAIRSDGKVFAKKNPEVDEFLSTQFVNLTMYKSKVRAFVYNNGSELCNICNKRVFHEKMTDAFICMTCRKNRANESRRKTSLERYGVNSVSQTDFVKEKKRQTNVERYGHSNVLVAKRDDIEKTWMSKYGFSNPNSHDSIKQKIEETNLDKYGSSSVFSNTEIREKAIQTYIRNKTQKDDINVEDLYEEYLSGKLAEEISSELGLSPSWIRRKFAERGFDLVWNKSVSAAEASFANDISRIGVDVVRNDRKTLNGKEIDVLVPSKKLGIEYHGLYWHSDNRVVRKHLEKYKAANEAGVSLLQFWSSEVEDKNDIVMSIISSKCGINKKIGARKTSIVEIDPKTYRDFTNSNHLAGYAPASVKIGLMLDDTLVGVMSFGKSRYDSANEWEMIRMCYSKNLTVVGGSDKMWKYFVANYHPKSVVTYADARISSGEVYKKLGFVFSHHSGPNYWYTKDFKTLESRVKYQKHKLEKQLAIFDKTKTERENMINNGYRIVSDAGNLVFVYKREEQ